MAMDKCPQCGFTENLNVRPVTNHMNVYVNDATKEEAVYNDNADFITVKGAKLRRKDFKFVEPVKAAPVSPIKPAAPVLNKPVVVPPPVVTPPTTPLTPTPVVEVVVTTP